MNTNATHSPGMPTRNAAELEGQAGDILSFDEHELELALKTVSWNPRDVEQFLRSYRAQ
jgi:hypothetical protein